MDACKSCRRILSFLDVHCLLSSYHVGTDITFPSQEDATVFIEGGENPVQVCVTLSPPQNISMAVNFTSTSEIRGTK